MYLKNSDTYDLPILVFGFVVLFRKQWLKDRAPNELSVGTALGLDVPN